MKKCYIYLILISLFACTDESSEIYIDPEIKLYFDRFAEAAALRGVEIDFNTAEIEGHLQSFTDENIKGKCFHESQAPNRVVIAQSFWDESDDYSKEFIVFHELGHCFLRRSHLDDIKANGICKSIMHSGSIACRKNYNEVSREEYLDELFNF